MSTANEISSLLKEDRVFQVPKHFQVHARVNSTEEYQRLYRLSVENPEKFWSMQARENLHWFREWESVCHADFSTVGERSTPYVGFFGGGRLNVSYNCLDRHVDSWRRNKVAILWQGEDENEKRVLTYQQLHEEVCRFANVLKQHGVKKGKTVTVFLPMVPELPIALLACARLGAVHSVVFSAFSAEALKTRINDCNAEIVITSDVSYHGGKTVELKAKVDEALAGTPSIRKVLVMHRSKEKTCSDIPMKSGRDFWWHEEVKKDNITRDCPPEHVESEDPLFILYTSGSTGKPKGVLHTSAGYLLYAHLTTKYIFDIRDEDVFWCTADVGWITGHSYLVYGPLSNGATVLMYEGIPTYPQPDRFWDLIEKYQVNIFYTAPTAIRALMRLGEEWPNKHDLSSLRLLGTVGEPINPEAWMWYHRIIGKERCPVVDTWWQTETGGVMITTLPGAIAAKPGSAGVPFFGVVPEILKEDGTPAEINEGGSLCVTAPWPGMLRGVYGDQKHELIKRVYFSKFAKKYFTGDGCRKDEDGYYWLLGRIDDVINVSAHRFATAEIESALVSHDSVAEAAVVGVPHDTKGQAIYCFVTLKEKVAATEDLRKALVAQVRSEIGPIATPEVIHFAPGLPKTRSGKIMRRILRKIAEGLTEEVGDTTTLADPSVVDALIASRPAVG